MSKARILADLISDSQITASEITGLELNAIQQGDTIVEVSDTGSGGKVVVRVDGVDNSEFSTGGIKVPSGTTAQRDPNAVVGSLRYNTTTGYFETFTSSGWGAVATPPSITGITPSNFSGEAGSTFTVDGAFFDVETTAVFKGADGTEYAAATVTFVNSLQITITNATNLPVANEPFKLKVTNGAGLSVESSQGIDAGSVPAFTTAAGSLASTSRWDEAVSVTVNATDAESTISGYAVTEGNLPAGLSLNATTGAITGTSNAQATTTYTFTVQATDTAGNTNTRQFNIQIVNAAPVWSSPSEGSTEDLLVNTSGSITLNAADPEGEAVSYTSGTLPTGLSLSGNVISGTPTVEATTSVALTASDGFASSVRNFFINVTTPLAALPQRQNAYGTEYYAYGYFNSGGNSTSTNTYGTGGAVEDYGLLINTLYPQSGPNFVQETVRVRFYWGGNSVSIPTNPSLDISSSAEDLANALTNGSDYNLGTIFLGWGCGAASEFEHLTDWGPAETAKYDIVRNGHKAPSWHTSGTNSCACETTATFRPHIGNDNFGGASGACSQPSQYMGIGFTLSN